MDLKLVVAIVAACSAGAFFLGRTTAPVSSGPVSSDAGASQAGANGKVALHGQLEEINRRREAELEALREKHDQVVADRKALLATVEAARAAGFIPEGESGDAATRTGPSFTPEKYQKVIADVAWPKAGEAAVKMVPLLGQLAKDFGEGKSVDQALGLKIFKWNQELQNVAVTAIAGKVPGAASNGAFTHPVVTLNLIQAALSDAEVPLTEGQLQRLREIGDRFIEQDARRNAGYDDETFALRKVIDECALKDQMYADIHRVLSDQQSEVLHPAQIRDRLGIDIYSSGTIWYGVSRAVDFDKREELAGALVKVYQSRAKLSEEDVTTVQRAAQEWADGFSDEYLRASADPIAQTSRREAGSGQLAGWQKVEQARVAAVRQLAFNRALVDLIGPDPARVNPIRGDLRVHIPLKRP